MLCDSLRKPNRFWLAVVCLIAGLALILAGAIIIPQKREVILPAPIKTVSVSQPASPPVVIASGKIQPVRQVNISPEVSGEIVELPVRQGQAVKRGDLLLKIKPDFYIANRDQADGNYKSALAGIDIANANLRQAEADLKRNQNLFRSKLVSDLAFEEVKTAYEIAKAQVNNAEGQLEVARAALVKAQYSLDKTTVLSPIAGSIIRLNSQVGERVVGTATTAGTEVMTIADLNEMEARVEVGEANIGWITYGEAAQLEANAFEGRIFAGKVIDLAASPDNLGLPGKDDEGGMTRFEVRIRINEKQAFRPGMSVTAKIQTSSQFDVITAPTASVGTEGNIRPTQVEILLGNMPAASGGSAWSHR
jgi:HlyD family secretion protein